MHPFKICCIQSCEEADLAIGAGALAIGLVAEMPNGPGPITDRAVAEIAAHVHARHGDQIWTTLLTGRIDGDAIADHIAATGANTVQIVDEAAPGAHGVLRKSHPNTRIMQVVHVEDEGAIDQARAFENDVDVILLDSGKPSAPERTLGGTGDTHDWSVSKQIVETIAKPVFLAGGLNPDNVGDAVRAVRPFGVDICSGLRDRDNEYALLADKVNAFRAALCQH